MTDHRSLVMGIDMYAIKGPPSIGSCAGVASPVAKHVATHYDQAAGRSIKVVLPDGAVRG